MTGLKQSKAVDKKIEWEKQFLQQVASNPEDTKKFNALFDEFKKVYAEYSIYIKQLDYLSEGLYGINSFIYARNFDKLVNDWKDYKAGKNDNFLKNFEKTKTALLAFHKTNNKQMDKELMSKMLEMYDKGLSKTEKVPYTDSLIASYEGNTQRLSNDLYAKSALLNEDQLQNILNDLDNKISSITNDPLFILFSKTNSFYNTKVRPNTQKLDLQLNELYKIYIAGQMKYIKNKVFYPDANSTLRVTYGKVKGLKPRDGLSYDYYTTLDGIMEKENPAIDDYVVFPKLKELYAKKDYGQYADKNGKLRVAFIASNHTTGGNSGSPVLNGKGELIGTNFDRIWEGTMSDVMYNSNICRNITLDVRYTLFVIDKYAGAGYLLKEMNIVK